MKIVNVYLFEESDDNRSIAAKFAYFFVDMLLQIHNFLHLQILEFFIHKSQSLPWRCWLHYRLMS